MASYVCFMAQRIIEMHRVLKPTGSLYLHIDPTASHYLKIVCDEIFGKNNFLNEIIWGYKTGGTSKRWFGRKHDVIFLYKKDSRAKHKFRLLKEKSYNLTLPEPHTSSGKSLQVKRNDLGKYRLTEMRDWWVEYGLDKDNDITPLYRNNQERTGFQTQKPLELLHRVIQTSSDKGDIVFDPFCGCATSLVAAQQLQRKWIGIDIEAKAAVLVSERLAEDDKLFDKFIHTTQLPVRTDIENITRKFSRQQIKAMLYQAQQKKCNGCHTQFELRNLEIDHKIPKSKGGQDHLRNYQLLCGNCNRIKGDRPMEYLVAAIKDRKSTLAETSFQ